VRGFVAGFIGADLVVHGGVSYRPVVIGFVGAGAPGGFGAAGGVFGVSFADRSACASIPARISGDCAESTSLTESEMWDSLFMLAPISLGFLIV
jgi:hypothetical protein